MFSGCVCSGHKTSAEEILNILSPAHQPASGSAAGPGLYTSPSPTPGASTAGFSVTVMPAITAFFSSLSPGYVPEGGQRQLLASTSANDGKTSVGKSGKDDVNNVLDKVRLACTIASCWVPTARLVSEAVTTVCSSFSLAQTLGSVLERKDTEQQSGKNRSPASNPGCNGAAAVLTLVAVSNLAPAAALPAHGERGSLQQPIEVPDSETLGKIGQADYPTDAYYLQTQSFSHPHSEPGPVFHGHYQGGCHTISDLKTCLFSKLERYGVVRDLHLTNATIDSDTSRLGAVACEMAPFASVRDMHLEHIKVTNHGSSSDRETAATGIVVGHQHRTALISGMKIHNCSVKTTQINSPAGIVGGVISGLAQDINVTDSQVATEARRSNAGIGAGLLRGELDGLTVVKGRVRTDNHLADAGVGAGGINGGRLTSFAAAHCQVSTHGHRSNAGVGAGTAVGDLDQLTIVNCSSETHGDYSYAGIGAGKVGIGPTKEGRLRDMISVDNRVITKAGESATGIVAGLLTGEADNIVVVRSSVRTEGQRSPAAIGVGIHHGQMKGLTSVNSNVSTVDKGFATLEANVRGSVTNLVNETRSLNTRVNGNLILPDSQVIEPFCTGADPRFLTADCRVTRTPLPPLSWNCSPEPLNPAYGSLWRPIEVNDIATLNSIGLNDRFPSNAHYVQTTDLDGFWFNGNKLLVFNGHYDGQHHNIDGLRTCLFNHLQGTVKNLHLTNALISAHGQPTAVLACTMSDAGAIENVRLSDCMITSRGSAPTGAISGERVGELNRVANAVVLDTMLNTKGPDAPAGMVAGKCQGSTKGVDIINSQVVTRGNGSHAGLGCGVMNNLMEQMVSACSQVITRGNNAIAGIGAGVINNGWLGPLTSVESSVLTKGAGAPAGIGAGLARSSRLENINAVNNMVTTEGANSSAGVTAGVLDGHAVNTSAVNCQVITEGDGAFAAVCTGEKAPGSFEANCTSVSSSARAKGKYSSAEITDIGQGVTIGIKALNTQINNNPYDTGDVNNRSTLCSSADPDFIQPDCQTALVPCAILTTSGSGLSTIIVAGVIAGGTALVLITAACCCYCLCRSLGRKSARKR